MEYWPIEPSWKEKEKRTTYRIPVCYLRLCAYQNHRIRRPRVQVQDQIRIFLPAVKMYLQYEVSTSTNFVRGPFVEVWQQWEIRNCSISFYIFELESFGIRPLIMRCCDDDVRKNEATVLQLEVQDLSSNSPTIIMILLPGPYLANPIKGGSPDHHVQG